MALNNSSPPVLNPHTPLAFLDPDIATQLQVVSYVYVATLSAYSWDWMMALPDEYRMLRKTGFTRANAAYFVSRIGTLGYCVCASVFEVAPVANCQALEYAIGTFFELSSPATSFLFFLRVRAVYHRSKFITAIFGFLWVAIAGLSLVLVIGMKGEHIPGTQRCIQTDVPQYSMVPIVASSIYDTLVFFAISLRVVSRATSGSGWRARFNSFMTGDGVYGVSRGLLQSGQIYYFATIFMAITTTAVMLHPEVPMTLRAFLVPPYMALASAVACRVFRALLIGVLQDPQCLVNSSRPIAASKETSYISHRGTSFHIQSIQEGDNAAQKLFALQATLKGFDCV